MDNRITFGRLTYATNQFLAQIARLQSTVLSRREGFAHPRKKVMDYGLAAARYLINAKHAANVIVKTTPNGPEPEIISYSGDGNARLDEGVTRAIIEFDNSKKVEAGETTQILNTRSAVIVAYRIYNDIDLGYFAFPNRRALGGRSSRLLSRFIRVFETQLASTIGIEFLFEQRKILNRRTISSQLRPNELFYQFLVRLHKFIEWERSAFVLGGEKTASGIEWQILAERLRNTSAVSGRIGARFSDHTSTALEFDTNDFVWSRDDPGATISPFCDSILEIAKDEKGLPESVLPTNSALVVSMNVPSMNEKGETVREGGTPDKLVVVLTDSRPNYFNETHADLAREFFVDVAELIARSNIFSRRMIDLWAPEEGLLNPDEPAGDPYEHVPEEDPDQVETIDPSAISNTTVEILSIDALQVLQLSRHPEAIPDPDEVAVLFSTAYKRPKIDVDFLSGRCESVKISATSDLLWGSFRQGTESAFKMDDENGISPSRVANTFSVPNQGCSFSAGLIVPIISENDVSGFVIAYRQKASEFNEVDRVLLRILASRVGEQIKLRRKLADLVKFNSYLSQIALSVDRKHARQVVVSGARELLGADYSFMMALKADFLDHDRSKRRIEDVAHTWKKNEFSVPLILAGEEGITGQVFHSGKTLAVSDISKFPNYVPFRTFSGELVPMSSELAVPIKSTSMDDSIETNDVIGVLSATWKDPHKISPGDIRTLEAMAGAAGPLLELTFSLERTKTTRDALEKLIKLERDISLRNSLTESDIAAWLVSTIQTLIHLDMIVVWSNDSASNKLEKIISAGKSDHLAEIGSVSTVGWTGDVIEGFRSGQKGIELDAFDQPSPKRKQIIGTPVEEFESKLANCISPLPVAATGSKIPVWAICLYRFNATKFDTNDYLLLQLASEFCESLLHNLHFSNAQDYALTLGRVGQKVALEMIAKVRGDLEGMIDHIGTSIQKTLRAHSVTILFYDSVTGLYATPSSYSYPSYLLPDTVPRHDGISEEIKRIGSSVEIEVDSPPEHLKEAVATSEFLNRFPTIKLSLGTPLFEPTDDDKDRCFRGIVFVNFEKRDRLTELETEFVGFMADLLAECVSISTSANRMSVGVLQNILSVSKPKDVFFEVLKGALQLLQNELPLGIRKERNVLAGNLFMVRDGTWRRLGIRANIGEVSELTTGFQFIGEGIVGEVAGTGQGRIVSDTTKEDAYVPFLKNMKSEIAVPIFVTGYGGESTGSHRKKNPAKNVVGVINIEAKYKNLFTQKHLQLISHFIAEPVSVVLYLTEYHERFMENERLGEDQYLLNASRLLLHNLAAPMRRVPARIAVIRNHLRVFEIDEIEKILVEFEEESSQWDQLTHTGLLLLDNLTLAERKSIDVIEQLLAWADQKNHPPVGIDRSNLGDFFIEKGHPLLIGAILENLYLNSLQNGAKKIWIEISEKRFGASGHYLYIDFHDNGKGIKDNPEVANQWLFRPALTPLIKKSGSTGWGIGLPTSRELITLMRGSIEYVGWSKKRGTVFRLRFRALNTD